MTLRLLQRDADQYLDSSGLARVGSFLNLETQFINPENLILGEMRRSQASCWGAVSRWLDAYRLYERGCGAQKIGGVKFVQTPPRSCKTATLYRGGRKSKRIYILRPSRA